jgi:radical SAM superfamily enzyme YgiQ (UPF0313 family)
MKTPVQVLRELDVLRELGWRGSVFVVDDNFIGNVREVRKLLPELKRWQDERGHPFEFYTEASVNLATNATLVDDMVAAGFSSVFLGIETPSVASLEAAKKRQNLRLDLVEAVDRITRAGLEVMGGFIVGFDNDPKEIFQLQYDFIQKTGIAAAMVGLLTALPKTQLYHRLLGEGRLDTATTGNNTEAVLNFIPKLDREFLISGYKRLMWTLYEPTAYYRRVLTFLGEYHPRGPKLRLTLSDVRAFVRSLWMMGILHRGRRAFWKYLATVLLRHPRKLPPAIALAIHGFHYRMVAKRL